MIKTNIETVVNQFKVDAKPSDRYTSFDYCYNYFLTTKDLNNDIEKSCLTMGFYLASWGMLRGSSFLLQKSVKHFQPTIEYIATLDKSIWKIDVDSYNEENIDRILDIYRNVRERLILNGNSHLTLITKILLGVFGFIPAYDQYFCNTFRNIFNDKKSRFRSANKESLILIKEFYTNNRNVIDKLSNETYTTDYLSEQKTNIKYPKAKIIDMYGFTVGLK